MPGNETNDEFLTRLEDTEASNSTLCPACGEPVFPIAHSLTHCENMTCPSNLPFALRYWFAWESKCYRQVGSDLRRGYQLDDATIHRLIHECRVRSVADLYHLSLKDLEGVFDGLRAQILSSALGDSQKKPWWRVLRGLRIRFVGYTKAKKLSTHFSSIEEISNADPSALQAVETIDERVAQSIQHWFQIPANRALVYQLEAAGLQTSEKKKKNPYQVMLLVNGLT